MGRNNRSRLRKSIHREAIEVGGNGRLYTCITRVAKTQQGVLVCVYVCLSVIVCVSACHRPSTRLCVTACVPVCVCVCVCEAVGMARPPAIETTAARTD